MTQTTLTIYLTDPSPDALPPSPILVDDEFYVRAGLGERNGSRLAGFEPSEARVVTVWAHHALRTPAAAVGLQPAFIVNGRVWRHPLLVASITVRDQGSIRVEITNAADRRVTIPYSGDDEAVANRVAAAWGTRPGFTAEIIKRPSLPITLANCSGLPTHPSTNHSEK